MYCSNIVLAHNNMMSDQKKISVNIISNPMDRLAEKVKMTNVIAARDSKSTSTKREDAESQHKTDTRVNNPSQSTDTDYTCVNIPSATTQLETQTHCTCGAINNSASGSQVTSKRDNLPFVVPSVDRSRVPVVDFRYYNNKPVYQGTTLPLTQAEGRKPTPLTVWHGLLFSLIIIVGTILGAFAGYGLYKACQ